MIDTVTYWVELSDYDIKTAEAMLQCKRYLYVGFMAHQAIEKIMKAYLVSVKGKTAPFSHSLSFLAKDLIFIENFQRNRKTLLIFLNR